MTFDDRGPNRSWPEDGSGMSTVQLTVTVMALNTLRQYAARHPEAMMWQPIRQVTLTTRA